MFTEYDVARGILKFQCKTWEFRATSYSVNSQTIIAAYAPTGEKILLCLVILRKYYTVHSDPHTK